MRDGKLLNIPICYCFNAGSLHSFLDLMSIYCLTITQQTATTFVSIEHNFDFLQAGGQLHGQRDDVQVVDEWTYEPL